VAFCIAKPGWSAIDADQPFFYANFIKADRLAENAGTSVDQLERFYLKKLTPSAAKVKNIQSFGNNWDKTVSKPDVVPPTLGGSELIASASSDDNSNE